MATVEVTGGAVECWDAGRGPALLAIHGGGTPGELLRTDLAELSREFRVITYDRRGYGESSASPRSWRAHGRDAATVIEQLRAAPAVLLGYSIGAIVALDVAVQRPELVAGVVLLDPVVFTEGAGGFGLTRERAKVRLLRRLRGERDAADSWMRFISSYTTGGTAWDKAVPDRREKILANAEGILADFDAGAADGELDPDALARIEAPVTIAESGLSPEFMRRSAAHLRELMPQARGLTIEESSHIVLLDAREQVLDILREAVAAGAQPS